MRNLVNTLLQLVHKLESTHTALPHSLKALEDALETLASDLHRVHNQLLLGQKALGNSEGFLRELVVVRVGREVHAELCESFTESGVCENHLLLLAS
jgi:hypothetical protein